MWLGVFDRRESPGTPSAHRTRVREQIRQTLVLICCEVFRCVSPGRCSRGCPEPACPCTHRLARMHPPAPLCRYASGGTPPAMAGSQANTVQLQQVFPCRSKPHRAAPSAFFFSEWFVFVEPRASISTNGKKPSAYLTPILQSITFGRSKVASRSVMCRKDSPSFSTTP